MPTPLDSLHQPLNAAIIGASGGIGGALVRLLLSFYGVHHVYGLSRRLVDVQDRRYEPLVIDYSDENTVALAADAIDKPLDLVIVTTGFLHSDQLQPEKSFGQISMDTMTHNMLVNTIGPSLVAKHLLPKMRRDHKTVFAALSARVGSISDNRLGGWYAYRASKAALNMMIKTFAVELGRRQPQTIIAGLHPGTVDTGLSKPFQRNVPSEKLFSPAFSAQCLLEVVDSLGITDSGSCFAWDGQKIPE